MRLGSVMGEGSSHVYCCQIRKESVQWFLRYSYFASDLQMKVIPRSGLKIVAVTSMIHQIHMIFSQEFISGALLTVQWIPKKMAHVCNVKKVHALNFSLCAITTMKKDMFCALTFRIWYSLFIVTIAIWWLILRFGGGSWLQLDKIHVRNTPQSILTYFLIDMMRRLIMMIRNQLTMWCSCRSRSE